MHDYYPPLGFYYIVEFELSQKNRNDVRFQTVSGLSVEYDMEEFKEGGENRFTHKLPVRTKYANMVLKRGMLAESEVINWCLKAFRDREFAPVDLNVILMNEKSESLRTWKITHAIPVKWSVSDFNASDNAIVIETLELSYRYFTIQ